MTLESLDRRRHQWVQEVKRHARPNPIGLRSGHEALIEKIEKEAIWPDSYKFLAIPLDSLRSLFVYLFTCVPIKFNITPNIELLRTLERSIKWIEFNLVYKFFSVADAR